MQICKSIIAAVSWILNDGFHSLTQESSLREVDNLRQQIYRIKGVDSVSLDLCLRCLRLIHSSNINKYSFGSSYDVGCPHGRSRN